MELSHSTLHHTILDTIVRAGHAPSPADLRSHFGCSAQEIASALDALAEYHGVVLHPGSHEIWVAHPFSLAPTGFIVSAAHGRWWGTCAWCSLGIAALVGGDATITTQLGWHGDQVTLRIENNELLDTGYVVHFPIPMPEAWSNVVYTCSMMLLFRDAEAVAAWARHHVKPIGDIRPVQQIWDFSREWYGRHLDPAWTKWTLSEAAAMFARHGLDGPIWELPLAGGRF